MQTPIDHKAFLASLTPEERRALTEKSDAAGLAHLAAHWGVILLVGGLILWRVPGWQALIIVQGVLLVFLFTLLHETCHDTPFKSIWLNRVVGHVCGFALFLPAAWFRFFHFAHHRYTQDPERDPELAGPPPETLRDYLIHVSGLPVWRFHLATVIGNAFGRCRDVFLPEAKRPAIQREAILMALGYGVIGGATVVFSTIDLLYVWLLPLLAGQPFLRLYLLAEHGRCAYVANMFENTRTTFTSGLVRKLAWNMPYHAEHHALPTVPFHKLPALHRRARPHLQVTENGYRAFHRKYLWGFFQP
ncbi:MAG: fatty acid desaturase [Rhodobacteraceae bacterium]|nr:fatty acid desaturase [Paracoccaceae bacterium]